MKGGYDIFISYRREGSYETAKHLYDLLVRDGYKVYFDIDSLRNGDFDVQIYYLIDLCKDFILIVDAHAFDRTLDKSFDPKKDWLRRELAYAIQENKNVIPVFLSGSSGFPNNLPDDVAGVATKNGPEYSKYYFNAFYEDLKKRFLQSKPSHKALYLGILSSIVVFVAGIVIFYSKEKSIPDYSLEIPLITYEEILSSNNSATSSESQSHLDEMQLAAQKAQGMESFSGLFEHVETQSIMWDLKLDPLDHLASIKIKDIFPEGEDIKNSLGYCGTFSHMPEFWEVTAFHLGEDGRKAQIELINVYNERSYSTYMEQLPALAWCTLELSFNEYHNLIVRFIEGTATPWIIPDDGTNISFKRQ